MHPDGYSKVVDVDQLILDPCHQERTNWIRDKLAHKTDDQVVNVSADPIRPPQMTVRVSIACQITSDTNFIVVSNDKVTPAVIVRRSLRRRRKPCSLIYYLQIKNESILAA